MRNHYEEREKEKRELEICEQDKVAGGYIKYMIYAWFMNLTWLLFMLWGVEFFIQEKGMAWMREPQKYTIIACSVTKIILSIILLANTRLLSEKKLNL